MLKDYVLAQEMSALSGLSMSNFSQYINNSNLQEGYHYLKFGPVVMFNKKNCDFPNGLKFVNEREDEFTDLSDLYPMNYFQNMFENNISNIKDMYEVVFVEGKKFIKPNEELKNILSEEYVKSVVMNCEIEELYAKDYIVGHIELTPKKSICWYETIS